MSALHVSRRAANDVVVDMGSTQHFHTMLTTSHMQEVAALDAEPQCNVVLVAAMMMGGYKQSVQLRGGFAGARGLRK